VCSRAQGIRWVMNREEAHGLTVIQQSQKGYIDKVISCIENGKPLLIENLPDDIDAVLDPVVGRMTMRKGQNLVVKIGDAEVDYDRNFRLYLQTKLSNPHYKPEINAQARACCLHATYAPRVEHLWHQNACSSSVNGMSHLGTLAPQPGGVRPPSL
jgi:ATP-binding dynein motor region